MSGVPVQEKHATYSNSSGSNETQTLGIIPACMCEIVGLTQINICCYKET